MHIPVEQLVHPAEQQNPEIIENPAVHVLHILLVQFVQFVGQQMPFNKLKPFAHTLQTLKLLQKVQLPKQHKLLARVYPLAHKLQFPFEHVVQFKGQQKPAVNT